MVAPYAKGGAAEPIGCAGLLPVGVAARYELASDRMLRRAGFVPLGETPGPWHAIRTYLREDPSAT